jgi:hypothetical protein
MRIVSILSVQRQRDIRSPSTARCIWLLSVLVSPGEGTGPNGA